jgi:7-keto-8-aminopelargonate synthetase-like enzyme
MSREPRPFAASEPAPRGSHASGTVTAGGETLRDFATASYLGLDGMPMLHDAAEVAARTYGAQLGGARLRDGCPLYAQVLSRLSRLSGGYALVTPSVSLGHMAAFPALIRPGDALVLDTAAQPSMHTAAMLLEGVHVEPVPHGDEHSLAASAQRLARLYRHVWVACDGASAMYGELAPFALLAELLEGIPNLSVYVDDSHCTSWAGEHGRGLALTRLTAHRERLVVALSLSDSFGASGGALVLGTEEARAKLRAEAEPMLLSGGLHPGMLGRALAATELHLEPRFALRQAALATRVELATTLALEAGVPLAAAEGAPIFFVPVGPTVPTLAVLQELRRAGYLAGAGVFPAVPLDRGGLRFTVSVETHPADLSGFVDTLSAALSQVGLSRPSDVRGLGASASVFPPAATHRAGHG